MRQNETDSVCHLNIQPAYKVCCCCGTDAAAQMKVLELRSRGKSEGAIWRRKGGEGELSSNKRFRLLSETAPNPLLTPLHVGHFCDKLNKSEESPSQTASHCGRTLAQLLTNTKKGSCCILGGKQFQF